MKIAQVRGDKEDEINAYRGLGNAYQFNNQLQKAIGSYKNALEIGQKRGDKETEIDAYIELGHAYAHRGPHSNPVQAAIVYHDIEYLKKALKIAKELEYKMRETRAWLGLGELYRIKKEFEMAIEHYILSPSKLRKEKDLKRKKILQQMELKKQLTVSL